MRLTQGIAALLASLIVWGGTARAELSCSDFVRGAVLEDPDVLAQAASIAQPLAALEWQSPRMLDEAVRMVPYEGMWTHLLLRQLARDCGALPGETVDAIVATHLKVVLRQKAAQEVKKKADREAQERYEAPFKAEEKAARDAAERAPPLPAHITATEAVVSKITCGQYLKGAWGTDDSEVERAFTTVLQRMVDLDPVAKTAHLHYAGARQYLGAFGYCYDHPGAALVDALRDAVENARAWSPVELHKSDQQRIDALHAKSNRAKEEDEELGAYQAADLAGPRGSCRWHLAYDNYVNSRHPEYATGMDMASIRARRLDDWCRTHPNASEADPE